MLLGSFGEKSESAGGTRKKAGAEGKAGRVARRATRRGALGTSVGRNGGQADRRKVNEIRELGQETREAAPQEQGERQPAERRAPTASAPSSPGCARRTPLVAQVAAVEVDRRSLRLVAARARAARRRRMSRRAQGTRWTRRMARGKEMRAGERSVVVVSSTASGRVASAPGLRTQWRASTHAHPALGRAQRNRSRLCWRE